MGRGPNLIWIWRESVAGIWGAENQIHRIELFQDFRRFVPLYVIIETPSRHLVATPQALVVAFAAIVAGFYILPTR